MVALAADRNTPAALGDMNADPVGAGSKILAGALVMRNATGFVVKGATATGCFACGRAEMLADNTSGANGAINVMWRAGVFRLANSGGGDLITQAEVGKVCVIVDDQTVDDQTVAKTDATATRSRAGVVTRDRVASGFAWMKPSPLPPAKGGRRKEKLQC